MLNDFDKSPEDYIREGCKFVSAVAFPDKAERFSAELLYQRVMLGLESILYGHLTARGVQPFSHNAAGLAAEFQKQEWVDELFCLNLVGFSRLQNMDSDRPRSECPFPLGVDEVRAQAVRILEVLGPGNVRA